MGPSSQKELAASGVESVRFKTPKARLHWVAYCPNEELQPGLASAKAARQAGTRGAGAASTPAGQRPLRAGNLSHAAQNQATVSVGGKELDRIPSSYFQLRVPVSSAVRWGGENSHSPSRVVVKAGCKAPGLGKSGCM